VTAFQYAPPLDHDRRDPQLSPRQAAKDLGLRVRQQHASWDLVLDAAVLAYWAKRWAP